MSTKNNKLRFIDEEKTKELQKDWKGYGKSQVLFGIVVFVIFVLSALYYQKSSTITKRVIDGGRTGEILCLGVIKNSSGFTKQVSLSFEFYCNTGGGIEVR